MDTGAAPDALSIRAFALALEGMVPNANRNARARLI
jgi:hypothetical protein